jgi:hypothetical protein
MVCIDRNSRHRLRDACWWAGEFVATGNDDYE